jgi:hypothetical protein
VKKDAMDRAERFATVAGVFAETFHDTTDADERLAIRWLRHRLASSRDVREVVRGEIGGREIHSPYRSAVLVTPGTGLTTGIAALFWIYVAGIPVIRVKCSQDDTWTRLFVELAQDSRELGDIAVLDGSGHLTEAELRRHDALVVFGSDTTVAHFQDMWRDAGAFVGYGSKTSIAVHDQPVLDRSHLKGYVDDVASHSGLGCLNTSVLYVTDRAADGSRQALIDMAGEIASRSNDRVTVANWVDGCRIDPHVREVWSTTAVRGPGDGLGYTKSTVGRGSLYLVFYDTVEQIRREWHGGERFLSSATLVCGDGDRDGWTRCLTELGVTRVAAPGLAQYPALEWTNGGRSLLLQLSHLVTLETRA